MALFDFLKGNNKDNNNKPDNKGLLEKTEIIPGLTVPKAIALDWPVIDRLKIPFVQITATPAESFTLQQSKFGHYPMMPTRFDYPKDGKGKYMYPLAQINFSEVPPITGYPDCGYLQFYISTDDVYGHDHDNPDKQKDFRLLYFKEEEVTEHKSDFSFLEAVMDSEDLPVYKPHTLSFTQQYDYVQYGDVLSDKRTGPTIQYISEKYPDIAEALDDAVCDCFLGEGHKIGGYAFFTQSDPRSYRGSKFSDYILLFQIDTDDEIMWGDSGVANFFIHPDDLAKKDFSKVMYNWDCC